MKKAQTKRQRELAQYRNDRDKAKQDYAEGYRAARNGEPCPPNAPPAFRTGYADAAD